MCWLTRLVDGIMSVMRFVALDVETANADLSSICQIGIAIFEDGEIVDRWKSFLDPEDEFDPMNTYVHGITEEMVVGAPTFSDLLPTIYARLSNEIVASHSPFDRLAISKALQKYNAPPLEARWLDTCRVTRRAWSQFASRGYGLANLAEHFGIEYLAHDALEDAICCGKILLCAVRDTGTAVEPWVERAMKPLRPTHEDLPVNPDGHLVGHIAVFTGSLSLPRRDASLLAAQAGCEVEESVTKKTTLVIVGDQDIRVLAGKAKSSKHLKAEALMAKGKLIRILTERDFMSLVGKSIL